MLQFRRSITAAVIVYREDQLIGRISEGNFQPSNPHIRLDGDEETSLKSMIVWQMGNFPLARRKLPES